MPTKPEQQDQTTDGKSHYFFILWLVKQGDAITAQVRLMTDMGLSDQSKKEQRERQKERTDRECEREMDS